MKTVLLTGATGGIGGAILEKFKQQQYAVVAPTRAELNLESQDSVQQFMTTLKTPIDIFVHCAGFNDPKQLDALTEADIQKTLQINTLSFYTISKALAAHFKQSEGAILAVSSMYGHFSRKGRLAYSTSKHALNGMIKTLALELGPYNVRVNGVSPGFVDTVMTSKNNSAAVIEGIKKKIPLGRLATVEDIAEVVYFLCSPLNRYINGECIMVDGGYSVGGFQE